MTTTTVRGVIGVMEVTRGDGDGTEGGEEGKGGGGGEEILAHGTDRRTGQPKVVQEVLTDLKIAI